MKYVIFFSALFFSSAVYSQYQWTVSHTDYDRQYYYCFDGLSAYGNIVTASGREVDTVSEGNLHLFWRSDDGGRSWKKQNSGLPVGTFIDDGTTLHSVQQIDASHAIAIGTRFYPGGQFGEIGDSVLILKTDDGGNSWQPQNIHKTGLAREIDFYDSLSGILIMQESEEKDGTELIAGGKIITYITSDGGIHWDSVNVTITTGTRKCYAFGNSKYKIFLGWHGPILSTTDNWKTIDTSDMLINNDPKNNYRFTGCNFIGGDTAIAYGYTLFDTGGIGQSKFRGMIEKSFDGGKTWGTPQVFGEGSLWEIQTMTQLHNDTLLAAGISNNKILFSSDHGATWREDSLAIVDTAYPAVATYHLVFTGSGIPLAIYCYEDTYSNLSVPSIIIRGDGSKSGVQSSGLLLYNHRIYPNPANSVLHIASVEAPKPYSIINILGQTVGTGMTLDHATLTLDISSLPPGLYNVISQGIFGQISIGKLMVAGK